MKPTYKGATKYPLYKSPPTKEELDKCKFVPVRVWIFENYYAIAQIDNSITVYLCKKEFDNFKKLHDMEIIRIKNSNNKLISSMGI